MKIYKRMKGKLMEARTTETYRVVGAAFIAATLGYVVGFIHGINVR